MTVDRMLAPCAAMPVVRVAEVEEVEELHRKPMPTMMLDLRDQLQVQDVAPNHTAFALAEMQTR